MAGQSYGSSPGRNAANAVGHSPPRSVSTRRVPIINSQLNPADAKALALKKRSK